MARIENPKTVRGRVGKGARLLDLSRPGWAGEIDVPTLALETCDRCVLGQLFGDYVAGFRQALEPLSNRVEYAASDFGFTAKRQDDLSEFQELRHAWVEQIKARVETA